MLQLSKIQVFSNTFFNHAYIRKFSLTKIRTRYADIFLHENSKYKNGRIYIFSQLCMYIYICKNTENPQNCSFFSTDADKLGYLGSAGNVDRNAGFQQGDKIYGPSNKRNEDREISKNITYFFNIILSYRFSAYIKKNILASFLHSFFPVRKSFLTFHFSL